MAGMTVRGARVALAALLAVTACGPDASPPAPPIRPPSILLVTLDTTRADAIGPDAAGTDTPAFNAIAARGLRFRQAYATTPETLPSHSSIMTGLYPAGHGVHENARFLGGAHAVVAERLRQAGYRTSAFVSAFVLARRFGLARGFDVYDDELPPGAAERPSAATTDRAIADLGQGNAGPRFMWVHYFDPHAPYAPAEPFRSRFAHKPYLGEVAAMDRQLARLVAAFEQRASRANEPWAIVVAGDHGEGLGDRGELQHGNLLYQSTMHVPLVIAGPGITPGASDEPVSLRRIYHTMLDWAGLGSDHTLHARGEPETVLGEAMKPFLEYGWQPQVMAVRGTTKAIVAGRTEVYDLAADPHEGRNLGSGASLPGAMRAPLDEYPVPSPDAARPPDTLSDEARRSLASLGYVGASSTPAIRKDAPRPADMVHLFETLDRASGLFVAERYAEAIPLFAKIQAADPYNLDASLRLAIAHSSLGHDAPALAAFARAAAIAPKSPDVRLYLALHYARGKEWPQAVPILERAVADTPDRLAAVEGLAAVRERQGRIDEAVALRQKVHALRPASAADFVRLGTLAMSVQHTQTAIDAFEKARALEGTRFTHDLELGVLYLAARRFHEARDALDRVPAAHPEYPMALFKRAQVSVLLKEPESAARIAEARRRADRTTRELIANERLFR